MEYLLLVIALASLLSSDGALHLTLSCDKEEVNWNRPHIGNVKKELKDLKKIANDTNLQVAAVLKIADQMNARLEDMEKRLDALKDQESLMVGSSFCKAGKSCRDIKNTNPQAIDGEYWVTLDQPRQVYCDMTTGGGGWMLITNLVASDSSGFLLSLTDDFRKISEYRRKTLGLSTKGLKSLQDETHFDQLRFFCRKSSVNRTIDISTKNNTLGKTVVSYFTGRTDAFPVACSSYNKMTDDTSMMAQHCNNWGKDGTGYKVNRWHHINMRKDIRLYDHAMFVYVHYHWIVPSTPKGRWECDDFLQGLTKGDTWKIFVR